MECRKSCLINIYLLIILPPAISGLNDTTLIIAKDNGLLKFDLQTEDSDSLIRQGVPFSIDYIQESDKNFRLYWSDTSDHTIYSGLLHNNGLSNASPVIKSKNGVIEGIAVDRLAKHLYWINSGLGIIEVSTLDGSFQSPLVTGLIQPRALAVDSLAGLLFWSDWNEKNPHIGRSTLSGSNHSIIVNVNSTKSGWINAIALVPSSKKIYWIDAKSYSIYEATYHGHSIRRIFHEGNLLRRAMGLQILHDKIYWSCDNEETSRIYEFGIGSDESPKKVIYESYSRSHGITSLHHEINTQNPCADNRFGCSHLCLLNGKTPACHCPYGTSLGNDNKTCQQATKSVAVFFQHHGKRPILYIQKLLNPSWPLKPSIVVKSVNPIALDYDAFLEQIFWLDEQDGFFLQNSLGHKKQFPMFPKGAKTFAVEGKTENIYLGISSPLSHISQCSLETSVCIPLIIDDIGIPDNLIAHNERRELFWLNKFPTMVKIESYTLDNTKQRKIITSGQNLCCMTVDMKNDKIFWADNTIKRIFWKSLADHKSSYWSTPDNMTVVSLSTADDLLLIASNTKIITMNMIDDSWKSSKISKKDGNILAVKSIIYPLDVASSHTTVKTSTMYSTETNSSSSADVNYNASQAVDYFSYDYSTENMDALEQNDTCSQNCSNNGHCVKTPSGQETCNCLPSFWGKNCEHVSCNCHYGKCIMQNNKIQCLCDEGVEGFLCNKYKCRDHCYKGKCKLVDGEPFCDCLNGWIGPRCNRPVPNEMRYKESNISIGDREFMIIEQNHLKIFGMKVSSIIIEFVIAVQFVILILMSYCLISRQFRKESDHVTDEAVYNQRLQKRDPDSDEYGCEKHKKHGVVGYMKKLKDWLNNNNARETKNNLPCGNPDNVELLHKEKSPSETTV